MKEINVKGSSILWYMVTAFVLILGLIGFFSSRFIVNPGQRAFTVTFGKPNLTIYSEGFYFKKPFIDEVVYMDIKVQKIQGAANAASKDLQVVSTDIAVNYNVLGSDVIKIYKNIGKIEAVNEKIIVPGIQESVKSTTAKYTAEELITKRNEIGVSLKKTLEEKLSKHGIVLGEVNIINFSFSKEFDQAIENKVKLEQEALTEKNRLDKVKYEAEQKREAAKGEADARITQAKAEAEAIRIQTEAIVQQGGKDYVELKKIEKWNGQLPTVTTGEGGGILLNLNK
ncbi:MAG: SPFH domain-containing protein [Candidatus Absconditabacteria bacterium]